MPRSALALTIGLATETVRESTPLVQCVAPQAATSFVADVLHGAGARSEIIGGSRDAFHAALGADAVALDLGTLQADWSDAINPGLAELHAAGVPWVLDATPLGRTPLRMDRLRSLVGHEPAIVRLSDRDGELAQLAVPGALAVGDPVEEVVAGGRSSQVPAGSEMLRQIPGVRAAVSALMAACATATGPREAALAAAAWLALASERADADGRGPASFRVALIDALWHVRGDEIAEYLNLD